MVLASFFSPVKKYIQKATPPVEASDVKPAKPKKPAADGSIEIYFDVYSVQPKRHFAAAVERVD